VKSALVAWGERYFYAPSPFQKFLSFLLKPFELLYCSAAYLRFRTLRAKVPPIPVVSVGNLTVGGSGKTPLTVALAADIPDAAIVLRGYGRRSKGVQVISERGEIGCDVACSGDEAMEYALLLPQATVIVAEVREAGIEKAAELGCRCVFLDDGYGKHGIEKFDIVIDVDTPNRFCLPAGPYRERLWKGKRARVVKEGRDFVRSVRIDNPETTMALVTAIARPQRLDRFLPPVVSKHYFADHHFFRREELEAILRTSGADALLVTYKDYVKIRRFDLPTAVLRLHLEVDEALRSEVNDYIRNPI